LREAARAAANKMQQLRTTRLKKEQGYQDFLWQLLTGHVQLDSEFEKIRTKLNLDFPPSYGISVVQFPAEIPDAIVQQLHYIITTALDNRMIMHTISQDKLIFLEDRTPGK